MLTLPAATTAPILIDLRKGPSACRPSSIPARPCSPRDKGLVRRFGAAGAPVVLVKVAFSPDFGDSLKAPVERLQQMPPGGWADSADGLAEPLDIRITKRQWGAFYGAGLDLHLRRRGVTTVVIGGDIGVESTVWTAHEHGYAVVAEDATAGLSADMHAFAVRRIFPLLGRVAKAGDIELPDDRRGLQPTLRPDDACQFRP
jgi:nicotinamidase-related amidase